MPTKVKAAVAKKSLKKTQLPRIVQNASSLDSSTTPTISSLPVGDVVDTLLHSLVHKLISESSSLPSVIQLRTMLTTWSEHIPFPTVRTHLLDNLKHYAEQLRELYLIEYNQLVVKPFENTLRNAAQHSTRLQDITYGTSSAFNHSPCTYHNYLATFISEQSTTLFPQSTSLLAEMSDPRNLALKHKHHVAFTLQFSNILTTILSPPPFTFNVPQRVTMFEIQFDFAYQFVLKYIIYQPLQSALVPFASLILPKISAYLALLSPQGTSQTYITLAKAITILCLITQPHKIPETTPNTKDIATLQISSSLPTMYTKLVSGMQSDPALIANNPPKGIEWFHLFLMQHKSSSIFVHNETNAQNETVQHGKDATLFNLTKFRLDITHLQVDLMLLWSSFIIVPNTLYLSAFSNMCTQNASKDSNSAHNNLKNIAFEHYTLLDTDTYTKTAAIVQYTPHLFITLAPYIMYIVSQLTPHLQPQIYLNNVLIIKLVYILSLFNHLGTSLQYYTLLYQQLLNTKAPSSSQYHPFYHTNLHDVVSMCKTATIGVGKVIQFTTQHNANVLIPPDFQMLCAYRIRAQLQHHKKQRKNKQNSLEIRGVYDKLIQEQVDNGLLFRDVDTHVVNVKDLFSSKVLSIPSVLFPGQKPIALQQSILHELLIVYLKLSFNITVRFQRGDIKKRQDIQQLSHQERLKYTLMNSTLRHQTQWLTSMNIGSDAANLANLLQLESNNENALNKMLQYLLEDNLGALKAAQHLAYNTKKANPDAEDKDESEDDVSDLLADRKIYGQEGQINGQSLYGKLANENNDLFSVSAMTSCEELLPSLDNESLFIVKRDTFAADSSTDEEDNTSHSDDEDKLGTERGMLDFMQNITDELYEYNKYDLDDEDFGEINIIPYNNEDQNGSDSHGDFGVINVNPPDNLNDEDISAVQQSLFEQVDDLLVKGESDSGMSDPVGNGSNNIMKNVELFQQRQQRSEEFETDLFEILKQTGQETRSSDDKPVKKAVKKTVMKNTVRNNSTAKYKK